MAEMIKYILTAGSFLFLLWVTSSERCVNIVTEEEEEEARRGRKGKIVA